MTDNERKVREALQEIANKDTDLPDFAAWAQAKARRTLAESQELTSPGEIRRDLNSPYRAS